MTSLQRARAVFSHGESPKPRERRQSVNPFDSSRNFSKSPQRNVGQSPQKYSQQHQQQHEAQQPSPTRNGTKSYTAAANASSVHTSHVAASASSQHQRQQQHGQQGTRADGGRGGSSSPAAVTEFTSVMQRIKGIRTEQEKTEKRSPIRRRNSFTSEEMPPPIPRPELALTQSAPTQPARRVAASPPQAQMVQATRTGPDKCAVCFKTVYMMERVLADGHCFHKWCMKCSTCSTTLNAGSYAINNGVMFCKPHFKQLFAQSGGKYNFH